ncbi:MAG: Outer membrane protein assembly factor BamB [Phycisphaerae bacterium]|nr:Outer membrane protein assembly factor BamB [Phycisphaerae bacterium]
MKWSAWLLAGCLFAATPCLGADAGQGDAAAILQAGAARAGFAVVLDGGATGDDGAAAAIELARSTKLYVHVLVRDDARLADVRKRLDDAGLYGARVAASRGDTAHLPYPDYVADVAVWQHAQPGGDDAAAARELVRILRPAGGVGWVVCRRDAGDLAAQQQAVTAQLRAAGAADIVLQADGCVRFARPRPRGVADWSHGITGSPGNNPCIDDLLVKAPFQTLWIAGPPGFTKFGIPLSAYGRVFLRHGGITHEGRWTPARQGDLIQAFNACNGTLLWQRRLEPLNGDGLDAPTPDLLLAAAGTTLFGLDAGSGRVVFALAADDKARPGAKSWGWYAGDGRLVGAALRDFDPDAATEPAQQKSGGLRFLTGLSPADGHALWTTRLDAPARSIALADGRLLYFAPPDALVALDAATGREVWRRAVLNGGDIRVYRGTVFTRAATFALADGRPLGIPSPRGILVGDLAIGGGMKGVAATTVATGKAAAVFPAARDPYCPKTGIPDGCKYMYGRCIATSATPACYFFSYSGTVIGDLTRNQVFPCESFRTNCRTGVIAGNGLVYNSPSGCGCAFQVRGGVTLVPVDEAWYQARADTEPQLEKGPAYADDIAAADAPGDWPAFRHDPARSGVTPAAAPATPAQRWRTPLPGRLTPPVADGSGVYVGSDDHSVYALSVADGAVRWRFVTGGEVWAAPALWRGRLYVGSQDGYVYCLRADTGRLVWRFRGGPHDRMMLLEGRPQSLWPIGGGVIAEGGTVQFYAGLCAHDRVFVYSLDAATGAVKWANDRAGRAVEVTGPGGGVSPHGVSPSGTIAASGDVLYVPQGMFGPSAFARGDGRLLWWGRRGDSTQRSNIEVQGVGGPNLSVAGDLLFFGGPDRLTGANQPFYAADAKTGRMWGADDPRLFDKAGRDAAGKAVEVASSKFGTKPIRFGGGIAPVVFKGGVLVSGYRGGFLDLAKLLATQFGGDDKTLARWPKPPPAGPFAVAADTLVVAAPDALTCLAMSDGRPTARCPLALEGAAPIPDGLAVTPAAIYLVTSPGCVICVGK